MWLLWLWSTSLPGYWASCQALANCFNMKTDLDECIMVKNESTIEDESRLEHVVINPLVVVCLNTNEHVCIILHSHKQV